MSWLTLRSTKPLPPVTKQVRPLTHFLCLLFVKRIIIALPGEQISGSNQWMVEDIVFFRSCQQLPRPGLNPWLVFWAECPPRALNIASCSALLFEFQRDKETVWWARQGSPATPSRKNDAHLDIVFGKKTLLENGLWLPNANRIELG